MRYRVKIANISNLNIQALKDEIASAELVITGLYPGSSQLVIEAPAPLSEQELTVLRGVIAAHTPIWFAWVEKGITRQEKVRCVEDVDRVTAMRIRNLFGGDGDPTQNQMKILTEMVSALYVDIATATSLAYLKTKVQLDIDKYKTFVDRRKQIIQEGRDFKLSQGW